MRRLLLLATLLALAGCGGPDEVGSVAGSATDAATPAASPAGQDDADSGQPLDPLPPFGTATLTLTGDGADRTLRIYDAADPAARQRGLMNVTALPDDAGMLFRFPADSSGGFWMKDTLIPLSIAFAGADGAILALLDMEPCTADPCRVYDPGVAYRYALEVNQGAFADLGVSEGWTLQVPDDLPPAS